jgi:AdoMet-dependent heme synthase
MRATEAPGSGRGYRREDLHHSPLLVFYEVTRACDLLCKHCRADAQRECHPQELSTSEAKRLIGQLAGFAKPPLLVLTGGDPLKRGDVFELIGHATGVGLSVAMTPSATPLVNGEVIHRLKSAGLHRLAVSLDGATAESHDAFRRVQGSFQQTLQIILDAHHAGLPVQINTTIARHNVHELDAIAELLPTLNIVLWSVFFLVPTGRAAADERLTGDEVEQVFARLWQQAQIRPFAIKTTEAPHYRRYALQQRDTAAVAKAPRGIETMVGTNDGKGVMFISHTGDIYPSGFMPIACGRFPLDCPVRVYESSRLFQSLRDADLLGGKCGECEFRHVCGGSRARAYALTGDPLAAEPDCAYVPRSANSARQGRLT